MSDGQKAVRFNITLAPDLRAEMETEAGVNWSAVAAKAFHHELLARKTVKAVETMDDVLARLRAANELDDVKDYEAGKRAGYEWMKKQARPKELRRLAAESWGEWDWENDDSDAFGVAFHVLEVLWGKGEVSRQVSGGFWKDCLDEEYPEGEILRGFVEGAVELWERLESQL